MLPVYGSLYRAMPTETNRAILEWLAAWLKTADAQQMSVQMDALNSQSLGIDRSYFRPDEILGSTWQEFLHKEETINQEEMEVWLGIFVAGRRHSRKLFRPSLQRRSRERNCNHGQHIPSLGHYHNQVLLICWPQCKRDQSEALSRSRVSSLVMPVSDSIY